MLYSRNWHSIVNQLYFNKNKLRNKAAGNSKGNGSELRGKQVLAYQAVKGLIYLPFANVLRVIDSLENSPIKLIGPVQLPPATEDVTIKLDPPGFFVCLFGCTHSIKKFPRPGLELTSQL